MRQHANHESTSWAAAVAILGLGIVVLPGCAPLHARMSEKRIERVLSRKLEVGMSPGAATRQLQVLGLDVRAEQGRLWADLPWRSYLPWGPVIWEARVFVYHENGGVTRWDADRWLTGP